MNIRSCSVRVGKLQIFAGYPRRGFLQSAVSVNTITVKLWTYVNQILRLGEIWAWDKNEAIKFWTSPRTLVSSILYYTALPRDGANLHSYTTHANTVSFYLERSNLARQPISRRGGFRRVAARRVGTVGVCDFRISNSIFRWRWKSNAMPKQTHPCCTVFRSSNNICRVQMHSEWVSE